MRKTTLFFLFTTLNFLTYAQEITLIDFGSNNFLTTVGNWNNITDATLTGNYVLIDDQGNATGETLSITDAFDDDPGELGTSSPNPSLPFPSNAAKDFFFGEDQPFNAGTLSTEPTGGFTFSGLEIGKYYSFKIFASRTGVSDNRETLYTITGDAAATATLDAANNTANVASVFNVLPNASGEITVQVEKGANNTNSYGFYYIGAIEMTTTDMALSSDSFSFNGLVSIYPNPSAKYVNISYSLKEAANVKMSIYDINGKIVNTILNEKKSVGSYIETWDRSNVASGLYILEIDADGKKYNSKLVLE